VHADAYPSRPITLVVPYEAGQTSDVAARLFAKGLEAIIKQPILIENRPGAGGNTGTEAVARATPDGYTLVWGTNATHAANAALYSSIRYNPVEDFTPLVRTYNVPIFLVASNNFGVKNLAEVVAKAKVSPGEHTVAVASTSSQVALQLLQDATGVSFKKVPYRGATSAIQGLMAGEVDLLLETAGALQAGLAAGQFTPIGVTSSSRVAFMPEIPSLGEQGATGFEIRGWNAMFAPKGTPPEIVKLLYEASIEVVTSPDYTSRIIAMGGEPPVPSTPEELDLFVRNEVAAWGDLIRRIGLKAD